MVYNATSGILPLTLFSYFIDVNSVCMPPVKRRWFSDLVSADDGSLFGAFSSCTKQPLTSTSRVSGFRAKQREEAEIITEELPFTGCVQNTFFIKCEAWMEMFTLEGVSVTPASFLLNFKPKKQKEEADHPTNMSHGVLCLFSCKTKEYLYHWYDLLGFYQLQQLFKDKLAIGT